MACVIREPEETQPRLWWLQPPSLPHFCLAEFEIWYSESFLIPTYVQKALKPGGNIRPGMIPIDRVTRLVSLAAP